MSNIDFTKPVETVTGIPVQIISTSGREPYPVVGYVGEHSLSLDEWTSDGLFNLAELDYSEYNLRNKATWQLPATPDGQQWHRVDGWTEEMLPAGYRPLLLDESPEKGDELFSYKWIPINLHTPAMRHEKPQRTTRPLPQQQQPQEPWAAEKAAFAAGETIQYSSDLKPTWTDLKDPFWVSPSCSSFNPRYRIKPKPQKVPLEPCDVPPGSVIGRLFVGDSKIYFWVMVTHCGPGSVSYNDGASGYIVGYSELMQEGWQIKRPTDTEWQPCYKETQP
jgi:hypothetical protein